MIRQQSLAVVVMALALAWAGVAGAHGDDMSRVMGSISVGAGEHAGDLSTVNARSTSATTRSPAAPAP